ncbi:acyl-CoA dehydrogenase [Vulcanisaeta sp. EB80]|uniref:acyl-CoA dehydrogenase family protein n=1 Tax=Vulcanisaeta sp. EB80 TaxID=1650660 RepID=UPI0009BEEB3F|nr:acyl-CoA dehydrogenase family protein [Vulcanisaeta sp. EB80]PLC67852.1 acyl-CoA dehydrogenase [Vulcanisaeta sp. EB80]
MVFPLDSLQDYQLIFKPEHEMLRKSIREFLEREIAPHALEFDDKDEVPREILRKLGEQGLWGVGIPEEYSGQGGDTISAVILMEELSRVAPPLAVIRGTNDLFSIPLMLYGTEEQKRKYLPPIARGEAFGAHAMTEPCCGSDVAGIQTRAIKKDDGWVINGRKIFISNADIADYIMVFARTTEPPANRRWYGITAFILEKETPGLKIGAKLEKRGLRGSHAVEVLLDDVEVPDENRVGELNMGFIVAMETYDRTRVGVAAQALGMAQAAFEKAFQYSLQRMAFGQYLAGFETIQFTLVEMMAELMTARYLTYLAAYLTDQGREEFKYVASLAKFYATEAAEKIVSKAIDVHGGVGVIHETGIERFLRDVKITEIYEGANNIQRVVAFRQLLRTLSRKGLISPEVVRAIT